jgi:hypothetical protein
MVHENVEVERYIVLIPFELPKALNRWKSCTDWLVEV